MLGVLAYANALWGKENKSGEPTKPRGGFVKEQRRNILATWADQGRKRVGSAITGFFDLDADFSRPEPVGGKACMLHACFFPSTRPNSFRLALHY